MADRGLRELVRVCNTNSIALCRGIAKDRTSQIKGSRKNKRKSKKKYCGRYNRKNKNKVGYR
jgi:hypothetical protein